MDSQMKIQTFWVLKSQVTVESGMKINCDPELTLGQKPTLYPEITKNLMLEKCEFCEKWDFENEYIDYYIVKNEILKMSILWKMRFENVNFVTTEIFKMLIFG